jgi:DNA-binding transcriptional regulator YhcF (GntR family)
VRLLDGLAAWKVKMSQSDEQHISGDDLRAIRGVSDVIDASVINPRSMLPAYLQLAIYLRGIIIVRQLPPGSPLPSEPELAQRYHVSRDTVRRAMRLMREIGLAEVRRGVGHFVTRTPEIRRVEPAAGSRVIVRMPQPHEQGELLGLTVFVVTEPGRPPAAYDTAQTLLVIPGGKPG